MLGLDGERVGPGLGDAGRLLVQIGRVEAHHPGQRLAVGEARFRRHQPVGVARRHLDMEAEHGIVADLEHRDAGLVAVARLERGDRAPPFAAGRAQRVERRVIAFGDIAALGRIDRRRRHQGAREQIGELAMAGQRRQQLGEQGGGSSSCASRSCSRRASARPSRSWPRSRGPPRPTARRPSARPMSASARSCRRTSSRSAAVALEPGDEVEPRLDARPVEQGRAEVGGEQSGAGAGDGAVEAGEQAAGAGAARRHGELEALAGRRVDHHMVAGMARRPAGEGRASASRATSSR